MAMTEVDLLPRQRSQGNGRMNPHPRQLMKLKLVSKIPAEAEVDLLAIPLFEEEMDGKNPPAAFKAMDATLRRALMEGASREGFKGKPEQSWSMHTLGKLPARLVVLL